MFNYAKRDYRAREISEYLIIVIIGAGLSFIMFLGV